MGNRSWLLILPVTIFLVACGQDTPDAVPTAPAFLMTTDIVPAEPTPANTTDKVFTPPAATPTNVAKDVSDRRVDTTVATPTPAPKIVVVEDGTPPEVVGVVSMEELYFEADWVVRVGPLGTTVSTTTRPFTHPVLGDQGTAWCVMLNFRFRAIEYLKGSGPGEITAVAGQCGTQEWLKGPGMAEVVGYYDTRWDDREAIVFLARDDGDYHFMGFPGANHTNYYQVTSDIAKQWLPAAHSSDGVGTGSSIDPIYLLDAPATSSPSGVGGEAAAPPPTISLSALRENLADLEAQASLGGTAEYRRCVENYYYRVRLTRYKRDSGIYEYPIRHIYGIESGQPPGIVLHKITDLRARSKQNLGRYWFEGPDPDVVKFSPTDFTPEDGGYWFTQDIVTARPLAAGSYEYSSNGMSPWEVDCNLYPEEKRTHVHHRLTVTAPEGTVHEAFFDPVAIGSAVGADGTNGVLEPAGFALGGVTTTISSLKWENGAVTMGLSPAASLSDYIIDIIDVTGTTTLFLSSDNASTTALAWTVADKPWADGDLLMLRIRPDARPEFVEVEWTADAAFTSFELEWSDNPADGWDSLDSAQPYRPVRGLRAILGGDPPTEADVRGIDQTTDEEGRRP